MKVKNLFLVLFIISLSYSVTFPQSILTRTDSVKLMQAEIWGGLSHNGQSLSVTTVSFMSGKPQIYLRKMDKNLNQITSPSQITLASDIPSYQHLTDHKQLFLNSYHYVTFSTSGDSDLYIFRTDVNGNRVGNIVPVIQHTSDRTNDMFLATNGTTLSVGYFKPPFQTVMHTFDVNLNRIGNPVTTSMQLPHNNIGGIVWKDSLYYMFTGDIFGKNAKLILTLWNRDWTPAVLSPVTLIPSVDGDGNWFATGVQYDAARQRWYIAFAHIYSNDPNEGEHIDLAVFDQSFALLERQHISPSRCNRPSLLLVDDALYCIYDGGGVYLLKYSVSGSTDVKDEIIIPSEFLLSQNYPNPFNPNTVISWQIAIGAHVTLKVYDLLGREVATLVDEYKPAGVYVETLHATSLPSGVYFYQLSVGNNIQTKKMLMLK